MWKFTSTTTSSVSSSQSLQNSTTQSRWWCWQQVQFLSFRNSWHHTWANQQAQISHKQHSQHTCSCMLTLASYWHSCNDFVWNSSRFCCCRGTGIFVQGISVSRPVNAASPCVVRRLGSSAVSEAYHADALTEVPWQEFDGYWDLTVGSHQVVHRYP